ncbi:hypothetical protein NNA36_08885 [Shimia sp. CNT1-13L.2]|uniref:calcium-binding protein n=1 Tax=Shimia sp. CNT1-13L.2 TaxID=2959663 RepID=UPI0020CF247C|nr:calcium-binding protein [Shimia sp. CNT1-13L.2]MCP9482073.1 hypothetical protein [Shimia sp. CNT1-13L.2]
MPTIVSSSSNTFSINYHISYDTLLVARTANVIVSTTGLPAINAASGNDGRIIIVEGLIVSSRYYGIELGDITDPSLAVDNTVIVTQDGSVTSELTGISVYAEDSDISVQGSVYSTSFYGVSLGGDGSRLTNTGTIEGYEGVRISQTADVMNRGFVTGSNAGLGLGGSSDNSNIANEGTISSASKGISNYGKNVSVLNTGDILAGVTGVQSDASGFELVNAGKILGESSGVQLSGDDNYLANSGTIEAGTTAINHVSGLGLEVKNTGTVIGNDWAFYGISSEDIVLRNLGDMIGDVRTGDGADLLRNAGDISGNVFLVSGNDIYRGGLGSVDGKVDGGKGNDTLYGGRSNDDLMGAEGSDSLFGKGGEDTLNGGIGTDLLNGGKGQDHLLGGGQADDIYGGMGDDTLYGGGGADLLAGGRGDDVLSGGAGADIFVFNRDAGNDLIADFTNGQDRIDLSSFGIEVANFPADLLAAASDLKSDFTLIDLSMLGGDGAIIIKGLDFSLLGASDFIL